ncbi:MAG: hypothetical protein NTZ05_12395 [Chloroflexi bacterium]|nr:hypothetical protein [Chloroflexota bacterium]
MDTNPYRRVNLVSGYPTHSLAAILAAYGSVAGDANWDPFYDYDGDGRIGVLDYSAYLTVTSLTPRADYEVADLTGAAGAIIQIESTLDQDVTVQFWMAIGVSGLTIADMIDLPASRKVKVGSAITVAAGSAEARGLPGLGGFMPPTLWAVITEGVAVASGLLNIYLDTQGVMPGME